MTTKAEKEHMGRVAALGCIVCYNNGYEGTPAACHHLLDKKAMGKRSSHFEVLPLCGIHHQYGDGSENYQGEIAVHYSKKRFEEKYGTERELLQQVLNML